MNLLKTTVNRIGCLAAAAMVAAVTAAPASAVLVVQDGVSDGDRLDSASLEAAFLAVDSTVSVVNDAGGLGTGDAVNVNNGSFSGMAAIFDANPSGGFDSVTPLLGEGLEMRFRFRMLATNSGVYRFGILNNGGDQQLVDNAAGNNDSNTLGFGVEIGVSGGSTGRFVSDTNTGGGETAMLGGTGVASIGSGFGSVINITDTAAHEAVFRITRTSTGYDLIATVDGVSVPSASVSTTLNVFHQLGWISGNAANDFRIDNVELDRNILRNGTFERGALISGGSNDGAFDDFARNWTNTASTAVVNKGLVNGSSTSAFLRDSAGGKLEQLATTGPDFQFDVDFATESGSGSDRSFNMLLLNKSSGQLNLRVNTAGNIQIFNDTGGPGGWQTIAGLGTITFSDDADNNSDFTSLGDTLSTWHLRLIGHDYGTADARYDILLYPLLDPSDTRMVDGITFWQGAAPTIASRNGLSAVRFTTENGSAYQASFKTDFAVDNVSLITYVPTPAALPAGLGLLALAAVRRRRR